MPTRGSVWMSLYLVNYPAMINVVTSTYLALADVAASIADINASLCLHM